MTSVQTGTLFISVDNMPKLVVAFDPGLLAAVTNIGSAALPNNIPLVVNVPTPVPPYCTSKSVTSVNSPTFTMLVALPRLIVLEPAEATFSVPVVILLNRSTVPVVTSLVRVTVPADVPEIFS